MSITHCRYIGGLHSKVPRLCTMVDFCFQFYWVHHLFAPKQACLSTGFSLLSPAALRWKYPGVLRRLLSMMENPSVAPRDINVQNR